MAFDWSTVAGPSRIPLTPPSQERTLSQIIGHVPFPSTSHGGHHLAPQLFLLLHYGSRRLDRSPRTPATRESITKRARISVSASPPSQHIQNLPPGSVFDDTNEHTTYQHRRRHISNSPTRPSPHLTPGLSTIFHNLNMESDNDDDPIPLQTTPLFPSHHPPSRQINGMRVPVPRPLPIENHVDRYLDPVEHPGYRWCTYERHWVLENHYGTKKICKDCNREISHLRGGQTHPNWPGKKWCAKNRHWILEQQFRGNNKSCNHCLAAQNRR
ncbi:hypothetical protein F5879DRAFT_1045178 [Lentinula edodes]|nr:hypothetical protein F5879DRAFT_1045178 [Lentinula edodes]